MIPRRRTRKQRRRDTLGGTAQEGVDDALGVSTPWPLSGDEHVAANRSISTSITVLGLLIVAISLIGLVNAITMSILEPTREIGVLRSIGARARDVRRIFATEGIVLALAGWLLGLPLGYGLARAIGWAVGEAVGLDIAFVFPLGYVAVALGGTVILALTVMLAPLHVLCDSSPERHCATREPSRPSPPAGH